MPDEQEKKNTVKGSVFVAVKGGARFGLVYGLTPDNKKFVKVGAPQPMTQKQENEATIAELGADISREQLEEMLGFLIAGEEAKEPAAS
jgi:hypothetical protein